MNLKIFINKNNLDCNNYGIVSAMNEASAAKQFIENIITINQRNSSIFYSKIIPAGIVISDAGNYTYGGDIIDNTITIRPRNNTTFPQGLQSSDNSGIRLNSAGNYKILHNTIYLNNQTPSKISGIDISASRYNFIECNTIIGNRTSFTILDKDVGMSFKNSPSNTISCNQTTHTSTGYKFTDLCLGGFGSETVFKTNEAGIHNTGLYYTASARVDEQVNMGNTWDTVSYPGYGGRNDNPISVLNDQYKYDQNEIPFNLPNPVTIGWFQFNSTTDQNCDIDHSVRDHGLCNLYSSGPNPGSQGFQSLIQIALDSVQSIEFDEETRWKAKVMLYEKLLNTPVYLDSSEILADFFASYAGSVIQNIASMNFDRNSLFDNQKTLVQILLENGEDVYYRSEKLRQYDELLQEENLSLSVKDSLVELKNALIVSIKNIIDYNTSGFISLRTSINQNVDLLNSKNESNNGNEVYEQNERTVNDAYLATVALNQPENIINYAATLLNVATQCPIAGGPSVYRARSLYFLINPEMTYDDETTCMNSGYLYKTSKNITHRSKLFPNPASNEFSLVYNVSENSLLQIIDDLGRILKSLKLNSNQIETTINVGDLENGMYYYKILDTRGNMIDIGQFIVAK